MKNIISFFLCCSLFANVHAQLTAYFSRCVFNTPDNKPYIETYLSVLGNTVMFKKNAGGKYQGKVEVGIIFSSNGLIKVSKKYNLLSPELNDTLKRPPFIDQQRFQLDTGVYELEVMITDKNIDAKTLSLKEEVHVNFSKKHVSVSDIEILTSFTKATTKGALTKNGFDLIPYSANFFPDNVNDLSFYAEVYNTNTIFGENEKFLINYYIESYERKKPMSKYFLFTKENTRPVCVLLSKFNIVELPSGNYNLVVDVRNKENELVAQKKIFFQRRNMKINKIVNADDLSTIEVENTFASGITGKDTLIDILKSLRPIASVPEKSFIDSKLKSANEKLMRQFLYNFWQSRYPVSAEDAWNKYHQEIKAVNAKFGSFTFRGYETDRGRIYLQYGPPDKMDVHPSEPNAYPYEIWVYYKLVDKSNMYPNQTNKQFVFYNRDLSSNNFEVLTSNAQGEINDANWQMKLQSRAVQSNDFEHTTPPDHFGGNAGEDYRNPH